ncbi:MAG: SDR family NAD(P)-dependent oxidoreductase [Crocinitomicaceae bacterium]|jgi:benzil reductase ((S)-benzoin forming)
MYIVTGVSRGLGKSIVQLLLDQGEAVLGIGRSHQFDHSNFTFLKCDLSDIKAIKNLVFPEFTGEVTLINNAGILGNVKRISDQESIDLSEVLKVNTVAPMELTHKVYNLLTRKDNFRLVNISSGAGNRAIPSWAAYCASKAALNMLTETFFLEEKEKGNHIVAYAVSPGVIDTDMQGQIRNVDPTDFSAIENFIGFKENNELFTSIDAGKRLLKLLKMPFNQEIKVDLRTL